MLRLLLALLLLLASLATADQVITDFETVECTVVAADNEYIHTSVPNLGEKRFAVEEVRKVLITDLDRLAYLRGQLAGTGIGVEYQSGPSLESGPGGSDSSRRTRRRGGCGRGCCLGPAAEPVASMGGSCLVGAVLGAAAGAGALALTFAGEPDSEDPTAFLVLPAVFVGVGAIIGGVVGTLVAAQQRRKHCLGFRLLPPSLAFRSVQTKGDYAMLSADFRLVAVSF